MADTTKFSKSERGRVQELFAELYKQINALLDEGKDPDTDGLAFAQSISQILETAQETTSKKILDAAESLALDYMRSAAEGFREGAILNDYMSVKDQGDLPPISAMQYAHDKGWNWERFCKEHANYLRIRNTFWSMIT